MPRFLPFVRGYALYLTPVNGILGAEYLDEDPHPMSSTRKIKKRIVSATGKAIADFNMIEDGDRVMACLSGGKDSYAMLDVLLELAKKAPINFEVVAVNLDQGQPGFPKHILPDYLRELGVPFHIIEEDTYSIVQRVIPEGKTTCSLCSRLRRGILYSFADRIGATKIALGHHRDDIVETFFLNLFYNGKLKAMPPKLLSDTGKHVLIRPLAYVREQDLIDYAAIRDFPIIPCDLCGSQENLKRQMVKHMLRNWEAEDPGRTDVIFAGLKNAKPSHLLDLSLFDFAGLVRSDADVPEFAIV
jgi:tRNA 2-thiocytidine biosynthesis protein TtcA